MKVRGGETDWARGYVRFPSASKADLGAEGNSGGGGEKRGGRPERSLTEGEGATRTDEGEEGARKKRERKKGKAPRRVTQRS